MGLDAVDNYKAQASAKSTLQVAELSQKPDTQAKPKHCNCGHRQPEASEAVKPSAAKQDNKTYLSFDDDQFITDDITKIDWQTFSKPADVAVGIDLSGSMQQSRYGHLKSKFEEGKQALEDTFSVMPDGLHISVRLYGVSADKTGKIVFDSQAGCEQTVLLSGFDQLTRAQITDKLKELEPAGCSPIGFGLSKSADDLAALEKIETDQQLEPAKKVLVLITDGDDTCGADLCKRAQAIHDAHPDYTILVIGYGITDKSVEDELNCLAEKLHGQYIKAPKAQDISEAVGKIMQHYNLQLQGNIIRAGDKPYTKTLNVAPESEVVPYLPDKGTGGQP